MPWVFGRKAAIQADTTVNKLQSKTPVTTPVGLLEFVGTSTQEVNEIIENKANYYISYSLAKHGKTNKRRFINAPQGRLKEIQTSILHKVLYRFRVSQIAHGFVKHRSPKTNALPHLGAQTLVKMDLTDFFGSLKTPLVVSLLTTLISKIPEIKEDPTGSSIELLAELLTFRGQIPQGAPSSPAVTNLIMNGVDRRLKDYADHLKLSVTRYADDITFSSKEKLDPKAIREVTKFVTALCKNSVGVKVNKKKTKVKRQSSRMSVTGVVVNEKANIPNHTYRELRARVHNYVNGTATLDEKELQSLRGQLEWLRSVNPDKGQKLIEKLGSKK